MEGLSVGVSVCTPLLSPPYRRRWCRPSAADTSGVERLAPPPPLRLRSREPHPHPPYPAVRRRKSKFASNIPRINAFFTSACASSSLNPCTPR